MKIPKQVRAELLLMRFYCDVKTFANAIEKAIAYKKPLLDESDRIDCLRNRLNLIQTLIDCPKLYGVLDWQIKPIIDEAEIILYGAINAYYNTKY